MWLIEDDGRSSGAIASASAQMSQRVADLLLLAPVAPPTPDRAAWREIALDEILKDHSDRAETGAGPRNLIS